MRVRRGRRRRRVPACTLLHTHSHSHTHTHTHTHTPTPKKFTHTPRPPPRRRPPKHPPSCTSRGFLAPAWRSAHAPAAAAACGGIVVGYCCGKSRRRPVCFCFRFCFFGGGGKKLGEACWEGGALGLGYINLHTHTYLIHIFSEHTRASSPSIATTYIYIFS